MTLTEAITHQPSNAILGAIIMASTNRGKYFKVVITEIESGEKIEVHEGLESDDVLQLLESCGYNQLDHVPYGYQELSSKYASTVVDD